MYPPKSSSKRSRAATSTPTQLVLGLVLGLLLMPLGSSPAPAAGLELREIDDGPKRLAKRAQSIGPRLFMPFFVDADNGIVSLYAVRNASGSSVTLSSLFILADGRIFADEQTLGAKETVTVNVRDLGLPEDQDIGAVVGLADFAVINPNTGQPLDIDALVGDSFFVDPINDFATGDPLPDTSDLCNRISTRFADGGIFDGTTFTLGVPDFDPGAGQAPLVDAVVYDESGQIFDTFTLSTSKLVLAIDTAELGASGVSLPQFGSIEWTLRGGLQGLVTWAMNASGKFSVGMLGSCLD